ncbi:OmpA family protein [Turneriella parva]|uniref:OmpA/MotB domain protein n=1 Tax=Turneriella parva (strain ATCC BAA-1111 / DSM 21527 / NCTC 11395 / H) TaxID=869212 RepID=I4B2N0_TURPD|nr:OmpA family protein [Turneriella parva]AFM11537.1 OmpA/MotB domain protein [Turneriella parva DSM 21527]
MEVKKISILCLILIAGFAAACGSTDKKADASAAGATDGTASASSRSFGGDDLIVDQANQQLAKVPVVGFPPFSTTMPMTQFDQYGENAATVAKGIVASMPAGYKLQIIGHANQHASKSAAYTKSLSQQRAKYVYNYFAKKGLDKSKMTYVGVGNSEPDPNLSHADNRRVTFKLVKK